MFNIQGRRNTMLNILKNSASFAVPRGSVRLCVKASNIKKLLVQSHLSHGHPEDSVFGDPDVLSEILDMSLSIDSSETSDVSKGDENLKSASKPKVIKYSYGEEKTEYSIMEFLKSLKQVHEELEVRRDSQTHVSCNPTITHCTRQQISRMGRRTVPLHEAKKGETHPPPLICLPCICNQHQLFKRINWHPKCELYEAWTERKMAQQNEAIETLTLEDLIHIHRTCTPGGITYSTEFDAIARRNRDASVPATSKSTAESDASQHLETSDYRARLQEGSLTSKVKCEEIVASQT